MKKALLRKLAEILTQARINTGHVSEEGRESAIVSTMGIYSTFNMRMLRVAIDNSTTEVMA